VKRRSTNLMFSSLILARTSLAELMFDPQF
jgi:hypothetical protein